MKRLFTFSSNAVRLFWKEWIILIVILVGIIYFLPKIWTKIEKINICQDYRLPYELSSDYWIFEQWCENASLKYPVFIIGDSVIWGQYVKRENTLSHYLNELAKEDIFANMGVDGLHPVAMFGLTKYYGKSISGKKVILQLNPLWMQSIESDLRGKEEFRFHHPRLVPQVFPYLLCYHPSLNERIGTVAERSIPFFSLINHIRITYFDNMNIQNWTMANPYKNPLKAITLKIPIPENKPMSEPINWIERGITKQNFPWVEVEDSFQWSYFKKTIKILKSRNNEVFVILGPFNTSMLTDESKNRYNVLKNKIERWFEENRIDYFIVSDLPSQLYADASHPLAQGYKKISLDLFKNEDFKKWLK